MHFSVYLLGLTVFSIGTSEFMIAGMLPSLTAALNISISEAGNLISLYAAGMVIGGPLLTALLLRLHLPDKPALLCLLGLYALAQAIAAAADSYTLMACARIVTGMTGAACFGVAMSICANTVRPEQRGRAASIVLGGLMLAAVLGVPIATLIDQHWGWRASFWLVVLLVIGCALAIAARIPRLISSAEVGLGREIAEFRNLHLWTAYLTSALIIGAAFAAFSYFAPILTQLSGLPVTAVPWLLAAYGAANMAGNMVVGHYADRYTFAVLALGLVLLIAALTIFALMADSAVVSIAMLIAIGLTGITLNPAMVARVMKIARPGPLVNTMHASVINIGLGCGTWLGGVGIDAGYGLRAPLWIGAGLATFGLLSLLPYLFRPSLTATALCRQ